MKKIVITQYRKEHSGSTIGAWLYHYGVSYNGDYFYSVETTSESMENIMRVFKEAGYEVEFIRKWELET